MRKCFHCATNLTIFPYYCYICETELKFDRKCPHCKSNKTVIHGLQVVPDIREVCHCNSCHRGFEMDNGKVIPSLSVKKLIRIV